MPINRYLPVYNPVLVRTALNGAYYFVGGVNPRIHARGLGLRHYCPGMENRSISRWTALFTGGNQFDGIEISKFLSYFTEFPIFVGAGFANVTDGRCGWGFLLR